MNGLLAAVTAANDAAAILAALMPLIQAGASGKEVTVEDVRAALAGKDAALAALDALIEQKGG